MIKKKTKFCKNCKKLTTHEYVGKECTHFLLRWYNIAWECNMCGQIHIQDTAYLESETN